MRIAIHLNGWRRLGIALFAVWFVTFATVLGLSESARNHNFIAFSAVRTKAVMVPAPEMKEKIESEKVRQLGRPLMPWEMEWNPRKTVQVPEQVMEVSTVKVLLLAIAFPTAIWLLIEGVALTARWIIAGFAINRSDPDVDDSL